MWKIPTLAGAVLLTLGIVLAGCSQADPSGGFQRERPPAPVSVSPVERGSIRLVRTFSGSIEPSASFTVSPKIGGRIEEISAEIGDRVSRGALVARLDDDEYQQALIQAEADLLVAQANLAEARSTLEIAKREIERTETLFARGVASDAELDSAKSNLLAAEARVKVNEAQVKRAEAAVESEHIRIQYARVIAAWPEGDQERVIAERFFDAGETVTANEPLLRIVDIDPLVAVIYITEKDYAKLAPGQPVQLRTDAYPNEIFQANIVRISPVFRESSRQARVELAVPNPSHRLKPGMFVRATVELDRAPDAIIVPTDALVVRQDVEGVFLVSDDGKSAEWQPVTLGIRDAEAGRVQILEPALHGRVITLGHQLVDDGSSIAVVNGQASTAGDTIAGG